MGKPARSFNAADPHLTRYNNSNLSRDSCKIQRLPSYRSTQHLQ